MVCRILCALACCAAAQATAQVSGSVAVASDYRFRGVSLSDERPVAQADLAIDRSNGWFAGLLASNVRFNGEAALRGQATTYAGHAWRLGNGRSFDASASFTAFPGVEEYRYAELHAGFSTTDFEARLSFAPNYFGQSLRTTYAEINGSLPLIEGLRLVWHAGALQIASGTIASRRNLPDARAGVEFAHGAMRLQIARVESSHSAAVYPVIARHGDGAWLGQISWTF